MPEKKCKVKGKKGLKYGDSGKCYTGSNKKAKVDAQRKAIQANKKKTK